MVRIKHVISYSYAKHRVKAYCACGWQTRKHKTGPQGLRNLERKIGSHLARR